MRNSFLSTERIGFFRWEAEDLSYAQSLWGDPQVTRYIVAGGRFTPQQIEERLEAEIQNQKSYGVQYWPLRRHEDAVFLGCCGLRPFLQEPGAYELGIHLLPAHWGRGYAREAAVAIIHYAFAMLHAPALFAGHHPENDASAAVLEKLGFARIGEAFYPPTGLLHPAYRLERPSTGNAAAPLPSTGGDDAEARTM